MVPVPMCPPTSVHSPAKAVTRQVTMQRYNGALCSSLCFLSLHCWHVGIILINISMKYQFLIIKHNEIIKIKSYLYFTLKFYILCCAHIWL